jgi:hypothetical protein
MVEDSAQKAGALIPTGRRVAPGSVPPGYGGCKVVGRLTCEIDAHRFLGYDHHHILTSVRCLIHNNQANETKSRQL